MLTASAAKAAAVATASAARRVQRELEVRDRRGGVSRISGFVTMRNCQK
jgi:hypothetical protein